MAPTIETLPDVQEFEGMYFDPQSMQITLGYKPAQKPNTVCQIKFPLQASSRLAGWLIEILEKLTDDVEKGQRLNALKLRGDPPQGTA